MRNRAKCKICKQTIESKTEHDRVSCPCDEITISGGEKFFYTSAKDYKNFLRVDDDGTEIEVTTKDKKSPFVEKAIIPLETYQEKLDALRGVIDEEYTEGALVLIYSLLKDLSPSCPEPSSEESPASP